MTNGSRTARAMKCPGSNLDEGFVNHRFRGLSPGKSSNKAVDRGIAEHEFNTDRHITSETGSGPSRGDRVVDFVLENRSARRFQLLNTCEELISRHRA
jgi:hypothetical protein